MRVASFNVQNMFRRPRALNPDTRAQNKPILEAFAQLQKVLQKPRYSDADKALILKQLEVLGLVGTDSSRYARLRRSRGALVGKRGGVVTVLPDGRGDWIGWIELEREAVDEQATRNTARVIFGLDADVLTVIEAEDRPALDRFNRDVLAPVAADDDSRLPYQNAMVIDGNDDRGIDVGLMSTQRWPIGTMRSHIDDRDAHGDTIFSRDCPEYQLTGPDGQRLLVLANHFKSKGYGTPAESNARRTAQAQRVAEIYRQRRAEGIEHIVIAGDLNDTPDSAPLAPLLQDTDLRDVSEHGAHDRGTRQGTYGGTKDKIDYLLLSPSLFERLGPSGVERRGVWRGPRTRNPWPMLPTITRPEEAASDHAAVWAEIEL